MSLDKSLKSKSALQRSRSVLTRAERIQTLKQEERWTEGTSVFGLPKVRRRRPKVRSKSKSASAEQPAPTEGAESTDDATEAEKKG